MFKDTVYIVIIIIKYLQRRRLILDLKLWEQVRNLSFLMLQKEYSAILLEKNNVVAFSVYWYLYSNDDCRFNCENYEYERERLIKLETKETKTESFGNSLKDKIKKAASCFSVT